MKFLLLVSYLFLFGSLSAQNVNGNLVTWYPQTDEPRISFIFTTRGDIANSGVETPLLSIYNNTGHKLAVNVSYTITDNCGGTKIYKKEKTLEPNERNLKNDGFNYGVDWSTSCKSVKQFSSNIKSRIFSVTVEINSIEDLTEKAEAAIAKKKKEANQLFEAQTRRNEKTKPQESYYNKQNLNDNASAQTQKKPTWQETNARINAENEQKYNEKRRQIEETQRLQKEAGDHFVESTAQVIDLFGSIIKQGQEEKEKKAEKKRQYELEQQQILQREQEQKIETARQKSLMIELRKSFFTEFPEGLIPLSSQRVSVTELFYFTYKFDMNTVGEASPIIYLSNVFPINQYADGTWPMKSTIVDEIKKVRGVGKVTLMGYFGTLEEANQMRNSFLDLADKSNFTINDIVYRGKKSSGSDDTDFWGSKSSNSEIKLRTTNGDEDFWETGQAKKKLSEQKKKPEQKLPLKER